MLQGWIQILVFFAVLIAIVPVLGGYMARVYSNERVFLTRFFGPVERLTYRVAAGRREAVAELEGLRGHARHLLRGVLAAAVRDPAHPDDPPMEPAGLPLGHLGPELQHRLVVPHEHELAVLRRRDDALVLQPDGRPRGAELHLRGRRDRGAGRADPRHRGAPRPGGGARQLLAGPRPHAALRADTAGDDRRARARVAGRDPVARRLRRLQAASRAATARSPWARSPRRSRSR